MAEPDVEAPQKPQAKKLSVGDRTIQNLANKVAQQAADIALLEARLEELQEFLRENAERFGITITDDNGNVIAGVPRPEQE